MDALPYQYRQSIDNLLYQVSLYVFVLKIICLQIIYKIGIHCLQVHNGEKVNVKVADSY